MQEANWGLQVYTSSQLVRGKHLNMSFLIQALKKQQQKITKARFSPFILRQNDI